MAVNIARYSHFPHDRKLRRSLQSQSVRDLLTAALQRLFSTYKPQTWILDKTKLGKPFLLGKDSPHISISHSGNWCACAVASSVRMGIDIEVVKNRDWASYCTEVFHSSEAQWILAVEGKERDIRGLTCWCRKEAMVKALGLGLTIALSEIGFCADGHLIALPQALGNVSDWKFYTQAIQSEVVLAVAWQVNAGLA
jgi:4'-phosphopantetheinyl transferase